MTKINGQVGISPEYVKGWTIGQAIREIVQNYLDCRAEFDCKGFIDYRDEKSQAVVKDFGEGLKLKHLVMGISEKKEGSIGQFGEGLKLALLVFAREGRDIEIWSRGRKIKPVIGYNEEFETDLISLDIEDLPPHFAATHTGTSIKFECSEEELEQGKSYFIGFRKRNADDFEWVVKDFVSLPGGDIWVNGSKVGEVENARFSYHLNSEASKAINRDRGIVDREELENILANKLGTTRKQKLIRKFLELVRDGESCWEVDFAFYDHHVENKNHTLWKRAATKVFGDKVIASDSNNANTQAEYKGYKLAQVNSWKWRNLLMNCCGMKDAVQVIQSDRTKTKKVAQKDLDDDELKNFIKAKKIISKNYNRCGNVEVVEYFKGETDNETLGMYNTKEDKIYILRELLKDFHETVDVLLHETVHKHSGCSDCTAGFEDALCKIATQMMIQAG